MKEFDLNDIKEEFADTIIKIDDLTLKIRDRTAKEWDALTEIADPVEQLAAWAEIDPKLLQNVSMKKIASALKIIARGMIDVQAVPVKGKKQQPDKKIPSKKNR
jgi:hypothetical protein